MQNVDTMEVVRAFRDLQYHKIVKSAAEVCQQIGYDKTSFSQVLTGKRNMPQEYIDRFKEAYADKIPASPAIPHMGKRLTELMRVKNISPTDLANVLEVTTQRVSAMKHQQVLMPQIVAKLANLFNVDVSYFYGETPVESPKKGIPVYNIDFTASDISQFDDEHPQVIGYVDLEGFRKCKWIVRVKGPSMTPKFQPGDFIGLEPDLDLSIIEYGQPYAITTRSGKKLVKIIRRGKTNENLILRSTNPEFDDIDIHKEDIMKLFKVHGPIRDEWQ